MTVRTSLRVGRRELSLSNLAKVLYPATGFTKGDVIGYYLRVGPAVLPHLRGRSATLKRYPDGVAEDSFFEKNCPRFRPSWMKTAPHLSLRSGDVTEYCVLGDLPSLVWAANLAALELHVSLARARSPERPTSVVFDLDPGPGTDIRDCARVALLLRRTCEELGLLLFPKTSGAKGLHLYVPLNQPATFEQTKRFSRAVAELTRRQHPELVVSSMSKELRAGKVYIDWAQNDARKTTVCAYSLRATERPSVSTPLEWDEVVRAARSSRAQVLRFAPDEVLDRVEKRGDLFSEVGRLKQRLPELH